MKKLTTLFLLALTLGGCSLFQKKEDSTTTTRTQTQSTTTTTSSTTTTKQTTNSTTTEPTTVVSTTVEQRSHRTSSRNCLYGKSNHSSRTTKTIRNGSSSDKTRRLPKR